MPFRIEDLQNQERFRILKQISYQDLLPFIFDYLKRISLITLFFWAFCLLSLTIAAIIRLKIHAHYPWIEILVHSVAGLILLPLVIIPVHEGLHIIPYRLSGAKNIRIGMDTKQFLFYVTAHRHVASTTQFVVVALFPFILISAAAVILILFLPGLWKWSFSIFLFAHSTMCAGDFALLNFYWLNRDKEIYTWDDADEKIAYFYERI